MTKDVKMQLAMLLAPVLAATAPLLVWKASKQAKGQPPAHVTATSSLSKNEKGACREVIEQAFQLGWEDSQHDLAKALVIGRERLPEAKRAYERSCEAAVTRDETWSLR
jgi:hypothetical protein